ncbi:MAG: xylulokinase [Rhodoluna sp.]
MPLVAGIDSSTQSCKVVIRDSETGELVRSGRASHPTGTEVDPNAWFDALNVAIADAGGFADVAAVSIGGQQHGMVLLDVDGRVIRKALLWNDTRSAGTATELVDHFGVAYLVGQTGSVPVASFTSSKVLWVLRNEPENAARVAAVCLPHDWLSWRLAGYGPADESELGPDLNALATDASDASGTGYFNPRTGEYVNEIVEFALGFTPTLPRIVSPGEWAFAPAEKRSYGIAGGAGDNAASGLGLGADMGDVVVSLGTSGTVFAVTGNQSEDLTGTIAGFASASGSFLPLVCTLNAARILDSFAALLDVSHEELSQLAMQAEPGAGGVVLIPYFEGERTPNFPNATGSLMGLTLENNTRANLARSAVEGMLCGLADGFAVLCENGVEAKRVLLTGGAAASPAVQASAAQIFGVEVVVPHLGEYVADGAARQASLALTGAPVKWAVEMQGRVAADAHPEVIGQYHAALASIRRE